MDATLIAVRLLLAAVFAVAGAAKLADHDGLPATLGEFGVPRAFRRPGAWLLPVIELAVAGLLVPGATGREAALAALGLLTLFCVAIARALARGERPDCNCFGVAHSAPIGRTTLIRNLLLVALAGLVAARPAVEAAWVELAAAGAGACVATQAWLWFELLRRYGRALRRIDELEGPSETTPLVASSEAPPFALYDLDGRLVTLEDVLEASSKALLLFTSPRCPACERALAVANAPSGAGLVVIAAGEADEAAVLAAKHGLEKILLDQRNEVTHRYGVTVVPTAVLIDGAGRVDREPVVGTAEVVDLIRAEISPQLLGEAA
jgi:uncharacterized membrane protein YphA (DoxX/SURF4 family)